MEPAPDLKLTDYDESGVDLTLIDWFRSLTDDERLDYVDQCLAAGSEVFSTPC